MFCQKKFIKSAILNSCSHVLLILDKITISSFALVFKMFRLGAAIVSSRWSCNMQQSLHFYQRNAILCKCLSVGSTYTTIPVLHTCQALQLTTASKNNKKAVLPMCRKRLLCSGDNFTTQFVHKVRVVQCSCYIKVHRHLHIYSRRINVDQSIQLDRVLTPNQKALLIMKLEVVPGWHHNYESTGIEDFNCIDLFVCLTHCMYIYKYDYRDLIEQ